MDLGASGGRVLVGLWDGVRIELKEMHRFPNAPVKVGTHFHTDAQGLWNEVVAGMTRYAEQYRDPPAGIGVDTWGVDFGLLNRAGDLVGQPYHYRDARTNGMIERVFRVVPKGQVFLATGIQFMQINTLFQLYSMVCSQDPQLEDAETLLLLPDLFHYWLTGLKVAEYTNATTTQMIHASERRWAGELLARLGIPTHILPPLVPPGTVLGETRPEVVTGLKPVPVIAVGSHDTASAVAGVPELDSRSAYLSSGTWSLMGVEVTEPVINDLSLVLNFTNEGGVAGTVRLLKNIMGLWLVQESQRQWEREGHAYIWEDLLARASRASSFKSLVDPDAAEFLSPGDMPAAIRAYCKRTGQPQPEDVGAVVRCCLESLALKYRLVFNDLESLAGRRLEVIRIVGGGSRNRLLNQFMADACERPVVAGPVEATALGNIMMQMIATGQLPDVAAGREVVANSVTRETYHPGPAQAWQDAFGRFRTLLNV